MNPKLALALVCVCAPCWAQTAPAALQPPVAERGEPDVKRSVIEDDGARIDELRVRGQTQQIVVTPKRGLTKSYEIIVGRSGRESADGSGATGKRVWNVLKF